MNSLLVVKNRGKIQQFYYLKTIQINTVNDEDQKEILSGGQDRTRQAN